MDGFGRSRADDDPGRGRDPAGPGYRCGRHQIFRKYLLGFNEQILAKIFDFLPDFLQHLAVSISSLFVGEGWHLTLGALFMMIVIFLPGGLMEGLAKLGRLINKRPPDDGKADGAPKPAPAE